MIEKAISIVEEFMCDNLEVTGEEHMIDLDNHHSVVFSLVSEGEFRRINADPPYCEGEITIYPRFAYLLRFDSLGVLQEQIDIRNRITPHIERE